MTNPLHARYFADTAVSSTVEILENVQLARDTIRVRFACPEIAERVVPGQFLMTRLANFDDPLLGRPLALYDLPTGSAPGAIDLVYLVHGKFTSRLCHFVPGQKLEVWGPLGNGFPPEPAEHLAMVAGGIGQTPFLAMARRVSWASGSSAIHPAKCSRHARSRCFTVLVEPSTWPGSKTSSGWESK